MPYISQEKRGKFNTYLRSIANQLTEKGELTYCIYYLMLAWLSSQEKQDYKTRSNTRATAQDAVDEFYRQKMAKYEDEAIKRNGDINI